MTKEELKALREAKEMIDRATKRLIEVGMFPNKKAVEDFQKEFMSIYNKSRGVDRGYVTFYVMVDLLDSSCNLATYDRSGMIDALCYYIDTGSKG